MAQRVNVILEDDLNGGKADETVTFGIDGVGYEIDLSHKNAKALRDALSKYTEAGRRESRRRPGRKRSAGAASSDTGAIRDWAAANGYEVSSRGRVPNAVREAYEAASC